MNNTKHCPKCKKNFPATTDFFYRESRRKDGLQALCKQCKSAIDKTSRASSPAFSEYQKSPNFVFSQLKYQAKKRSMPFLISEVHYLSELAHAPCHYCGSTNTKHWVDRYHNDHSIGYTKENTVPCCELCNKMKVSLEPQVFLSHINKIHRHQSSSS
jgi:hypothetical protein